MKKQTYYKHNDIPVEFDVLVNGRPAKPISVTVDIYDPERFIATKMATVKGTGVFYLLKKEVVDKVGEYTLVFNCHVRNYGTQSHEVKLKVDKLPIKEKQLKSKENAVSV